VLILSLDIAGAFDSVNHERLVEKAEKLAGFDNRALRLLRSYLRGRQQKVRLRRGHSGWRQIETGVPQGSVLGPGLYALYTADIEDYVVDGDIVAFADDTTIIVSVPSLSEVIDKMKKAVQQMELSCKDNNLVVDSNTRNKSKNNGDRPQHTKDTSGAEEGAIG